MSLVKKTLDLSTLMKKKPNNPNTPLKAATTSPLGQQIHAKQMQSNMQTMQNLQGSRAAAKPNTSANAANLKAQLSQPRKPIGIGQPVTPQMRASLGASSQTNNMGLNAGQTAQAQPLGTYKGGATAQPLGTYKGGAQQVNFASTTAAKPLGSYQGGAQAQPLGTYKTTAAKPTNYASGMSSGMQAEIKRKAQAGIKMDSPSAQKTALYNSFLKNPTATKPLARTTATATPLKATTPVKPVAKTTASKNVAAAIKAMSPAMQNEIKRKALAGEKMDSTTEAKRFLYQSFLPTSGGAAKPAPTQPAKPVAPKYTDVSEYLTDGQPTQETATAPSGMAAPTDHGIENWNSNQSKPDYLGMTPDMIQKALAGLTGGGQQYNPENDAVYQAMQKLNESQSNKASLDSMEQMNERGILNSTVTSDRIGQIKQSGSDALLGMIPGLSANHQNQQANNQAGLQNLLNSVLGAGQFQQTFGEGNRQFDKNFSLDEAETTGRYMPPEAKGILDSVMKAKQAVSVKGISPADKARAVQQAAQGYQQLAAMGIDTSGINGNVAYADAVGNMANMGRNTLPQQKMDLEKTQVMGRESNTQAQGLIQIVLKAKQNAENKVGDRQANIRAADNARAQLEAMGIDTSGIGGNMKYEQAVNNASNIGKNTLGRDTLNHDARQMNADRAFEKDSFGKELAFKKDSFGKEMGLEKDKLSFAQDSFGREQSFKENSFDREMNFEEQNAMIQADLESRGLDMEEIKLTIDQFNSQSDADYKLYQQNSGTSETQAKQNTNSAIGEAMQAGSASDALAFLSESASSWASSGVDVRKVIDAINQRFPETKDITSGGDTSGGRYGTP
jgi:hypothetical protein